MRMRTSPRDVSGKPWSCQNPGCTSSKDVTSHRTRIHGCMCVALNLPGDWSQRCWEHAERANQLSIRRACAVYSIKAAAAADRSCYVTFCFFIVDTFDAPTTTVSFLSVNRFRFRFRVVLLGNAALWPRCCTVTLFQPTEAWSPPTNICISDGPFWYRYFIIDSLFNSVSTKHAITGYW